MSQAERRVRPGRIGISGTLVCAIAAVMAVCFPDWPVLPSAETGIHSWMSADGISPLTLYAQYAIRLALFSAVAMLAWNRRRDLLRDAGRARDRFRRAGQGMKDRACGWLAAAVLAGILVRHGLTPPNEWFTLFYHEGEWLGLIPTLEQWPHPLAHMFLEHGLGVDVLPDAIARMIVPDGSLIAGARVARMLLFTGFWLGLWQVLGQIVRGAGVRRPGAGRLLCVALLAASLGVLWSFGADPVVDLPLRREVLLFQMALALSLVRPGAPPAWRAALLGAMAPAAFLWNMGDAVTGLAVTVAGVGLLAADSPMRCLRASAAAGAGAAACTLAIWLTMPEFARTLPGTLLYWGRYGRDIWAHGVPHLMFDGPFPRSILAVQAACLAAFAVRARRSGLRAAARSHPAGLLLLGTSLIYMRVPLELGMPHYFGIAGLFAALAGIEAVMTDRKAIMAALPAMPRPAVVATLLLAPPAMSAADPWGMLARPAAVAAAYSIPDTALLSPGTRQAVDALRPLFAGQKCTVVLESSAAWHYLLRIPGCSRFLQPIYGSAPEAQEEMISDLERELPRYIIHDTPPDDIDRGLPHSQHVPLLYAYVGKHYAPFTEAGGVSVWRRAD